MTLFIVMIIATAVVLTSFWCGYAYGRGGAYEEGMDDAIRVYEEVIEEANYGLHE